MNIKSIKNSISFIAVAVFLMSASHAFAYVPGVWDPTPRVQDNQPAFYKVPITYDAPVVVQTTPTTVTNTNNTASTPKTVATAPKVVTRTVYRDRPATDTSGYAPADTRDLPPVVTTDNSGNDLAALSLAGTGSFMPSSVWQWLLVVLLILVIVIIARSLSRGSTHHDTHTVTAH